MTPVFRPEVTVMSNTGIAKIFMHGRSQAVRLPLAFRLPGDRVRVRRVKSGFLLEPTDIEAWFAELDRFTANVAEFARVRDLLWQDWTAKA